MKVDFSNLEEWIMGRTPEHELLQARLPQAMVDILERPFSREERLFASTIIADKYSAKKTASEYERLFYNVYFGACRARHGSHRGCH